MSIDDLRFVSSLADGCDQLLMAHLAQWIDHHTCSPSVVVHLDALDTVEEKHPGYGFYKGYRCKVPSADLVSGGLYKLKIVVNGVIQRSRSFTLTIK